MSKPRAQNGKGDKTRVSDFKAYQNGYDAIKWSKDKPKEKK